MVIGLKDILKMVGIITMMACAGLICTLFLNYNIDLTSISDKILAGPMEELYNAQILSGKVLIGTAGGCLILTTFVMLLFYIKFYIDNHCSELGILKALGYSNFKIAKGFYKFGLSVFAGTSIGFLLAHLIMGSYYEIQLEDGILPTFEPNSNPILLVFIVLVPTIIFSFVSIIYAYFKLKQPALDLIKGKVQHKKKQSAKNTDLPFLIEMRKDVLRSKKALTFFIGFAAFCFSTMLQMSASVTDLASPMLGALMLGIGIVLSIVTMILALSTLMRSQRKNIGLMRIFGYQMAECKKSILGCYRKVVIIGFVLGTIYQYVLLRVVVDIVLRDVNVPELNFSIPALLVTAIAFVVLYEGLLYYFSGRIKNLPIKEIMLEAD